MDYQSIILELIVRVQKLEEEVKEIKAKFNETTTKKMTTEDIKKYIFDIIEQSKENEIIIVSGEIHKALPVKNSMPMVCNAMYALMKENDEILEKSPSGYSATLKIKYNKNNL